MRVSVMGDATRATVKVFAVGMTGWFDPNGLGWRDIGTDIGRIDDDDSRAIFCKSTGDSRVVPL